MGTVIDDLFDTRPRSPLCYRKDLTPVPGTVYRLSLTGVSRIVERIDTLGDRFEVVMRVLDGPCVGRVVSLTLTEFLCYAHRAASMEIRPVISNGIPRHFREAKLRPAAAAVSRRA